MIMTCYSFKVVLHDLKTKDLKLLVLLSVTAGYSTMNL